jgi:hypothetical protein
MGPTFLDPTPSQHPYDHNPDWIRSPDTLDFAPARFNNRSVFPFHIPDLIEITPSFFAAQVLRIRHYLVARRKGFRDILGNFFVMSEQV